MASTGDRGRHRLTAAAPDGADPDRQDADTVVLPLPMVLRPETTPRAERPATGLAKFDLGTIPASVTPPRSWRRAAWFSVGSAVLVVVGLAFAAAVLMGAPRDPGRVDALPGLPSGEPMLPPDATTKVGDPKPNTARVDPTTTRTPTSEPGPTDVVMTTPAAGGAVDTAAPTATGQPAGTSTTPAEPSRTIVSSPVLLAPQNDPVAMGDRTQEYFQQVATDPAAAYALTSGSLRQAGPESIEQRYAGVDRIEVTGIVVDPARSRTKASLRVVGKDGSVSRLDRELTFTAGADPRIIAERAAA